MPIPVFSLPQSDHSANWFLRRFYHPIFIDTIAITLATTFSHPTVQHSFDQQIRSFAMDTRTPTLIMLGLLLAAVAFSVLGLAADNISYYDKNQDSAIDIHYIRWNSTAEAQYSYWMKLDYAPSRLTLSREQAELITGLFCALIGAGIAIGAWFFRAQKTPKDGSFQKRFLSFLPIALMLASIAFFISLGVTIWAWQPTMQWSIKFLNSLPLPPSVSGAARQSPIKYQAPFDYTPEIWNCLLAPYVINASQSERMSTLCSEAKVAKYMMIPVVLLSAVLVIALGLAYRKSTQIASSETEMSNVKDVDEVSVESKEDNEKKDYN